MKKVLLINAARYFFDEGRSLLDRKDFQVFMAADAKQALQIHRQERVNLIVSDLEMPEMGGDVLCAHIRNDAETRTVSVVLICHDSPPEIARAARSGANAWVVKPFKAKALLEQVERLLSISVRRGYRVLLRARVKSLQEDKVFFCTSENISVTGMLIETDRTLAIGDQISCSFYLPGSAHIVAEGDVARVLKLPDGKYHYGVRFLALPEGFRREIETFINSSIDTVPGPAAVLRPVPTV
jgi:CheY-like chemotaxis protein